MRKGRKPAHRSDDGTDEEGQQQQHSNTHEAECSRGHRPTGTRARGRHLPCPGDDRDVGARQVRASSIPNQNQNVDVVVDEPPSETCTATPSSHRRRVARRPSPPEPPIEILPRRARRPPRVVRQGRGGDACAPQEPRLGPRKWSSISFLPCSLFLC
jgi:hypothetical protein